MRYIIAVAVGTVLSAGAAQAAVYQYDVTMELESLTLGAVSGQSSNWAPDPQIQGLKCGPTGQPDVTHYCTGTADFTSNRYGLDFLSAYTPSISAILTLDTDYDPFDAGGLSPECSGSNVICRGLHLGEELGYSASSEGFRISPSGRNFNFRVDDDGLLYEVDKGGIRFTLGDMLYYSSGGNLLADYTTTSLSITEIAPIPLPASLPLLGVGIAAVGWVARRRRS